MHADPAFPLQPCTLACTNSEEGKSNHPFWKSRMISGDTRKYTTSNVHDLQKQPSASGILERRDRGHAAAQPGCIQINQHHCSPALCMLPQTPGMHQTPCSSTRQSEDSSYLIGEYYPHTEACTPSGVLPQTPLLLPQFILLILDSLAPACGLDAAEVERSFKLLLAATASLGAKP